MISLLVAFSSMAWAQVASTPVFAGTYTENFDDIDATGAPSRCLDDRFGGTASVCATGSIGGIQVRPSLFLGCLQNARSTPHLASSNDGAVHIDFAAGVRRFGGYFSTHATTTSVPVGGVTITLYDTAGTVLLEETRSLTSACDWNWRGYTSTTPIAHIRIASTQNGGALIDLDDLQMDVMSATDRDADGSPAGVDCDDLDRNRTPGKAETCDGLDNNCDGVVPANESDGDGDSWPGCDDCDDDDATIHPGRVDDCDQIDDDCDGSDGNAPVSRPATSLRDGVCADAESVCTESGWEDPDFSMTDDYESSEASCDGLDNDCDGRTDEALTGAEMLGGRGVCRGVTLVCGSAGDWVEPTGWEDSTTYEAVEVACDGLDNDCNGGVDDIADRPPADKQIGVCFGSTKVCTNGAWTEPNYAHLPDYAEEELCDGELDNDCDGTFMTQCPPRWLAGCATGPSPGALGFGLTLIALILRRRRRR